jgi:hypothetical protein
MIWNPKVCARTQETRFIQVRVARVATLHLFGVVYRAVRLVLSPEGLWMSSYVPGPPLYSPGGGCLVGYKVGVLIGLHDTSPSRITKEF